MAGRGMSRLTIRTLALVGALCALPSVVFAELYDVPVLIETEQDIRDLYGNGDISEDELERLLVLFDEPVDLNSADRDELYELPGLTYGMVDAILRVRGQRENFESFSDLLDIAELSDSALQQIRPFVVVEPPFRLEIPEFRGKARTGYVDNFSDDAVGTTFVRTQLVVEEIGELGWAGILDEQPGLLRFVAEPSDGNSQPYFLSSPQRLQLNPLAKLYVSTDQRLGEDARFRAIGGSFVAGFGERLTFDTTTKANPNGWYADRHLYFSADRGVVTPRRGLFGGAVTVEKLAIGEATFDWTVFASRQRHRLYQYDFNLIVDDPDDPFQTAKSYFSLESAAAGPDGCYKEGRCHAYETFDEVFQETIVGGNQTIRFGERHQLGLTGYWARNQFVVGDDQIVFSPLGSLPPGPERTLVGGPRWGRGFWCI